MKGYRRVVVATDFSEASRATIGALEAVAREADVTVHVVHVLEPIDVPVGEPFVYAMPAAKLAEYEQARRQEAKDELARFVSVLQKRVPGVRVRMHLVEGVPGVDICRVAESVRAHLVIVGSHGRTGFRRALLGSVAERVARHAGRPVLIVPGAGAHHRRR